MVRSRPQYTTLNVADTTFDGNKAGLRGGAIHVQGDADDANYAGSATIENSAFNGNAAGQIGGAIYAENTALSVTGTSFTDNTVAVDGKANAGGAMYINSSGRNCRHDQGFDLYEQYGRLCRRCQFGKRYRLERWRRHCLWRWCPEYRQYAVRLEFWEVWAVR